MKIYRDAHREKINLYGRIFYNKHEKEITKKNKEKKKHNKEERRKAGEYIRKPGRPAALAFVSYGFVLVRVRVRVQLGVGGISAESPL